MNLVNDPWIPVIYHNKESKKVSLEQLYQDAESIRDLVVTPPQRVAVMRLLICITQAALDGPEDEEEWYECRDRIVGESLRYLNEKQVCFELYGERGFLQVAGIEELNNATLDKLDFSLASGNNHTLLDHEASPEGRQWQDAWVTLMLITYQCFSPGGLIGVTQWDGISTSKTSEHAVCLEESALHTIVIGNNILDTVYFNLLTKEIVEDLPNIEWGKPIWEKPQLTLNDTQISGLIGSYLGRLVPLCRAIKLKKNSKTFTLANGISYRKLPVYRDSTTTVIIKNRSNREVYGNLSIDLSKHAWRELSSILSLMKDSMTGGAPCLEHLRNLDDQLISIWTGGLAADKGKILDASNWNFTFSSSLLSETALKHYKDGIDTANTGQRQLYFGIKDYCTELKQENTLSSKSRRHYWSSLDQQYQTLIGIASRNENEAEWKDTVTSAMHAAYAFACPHTTPRQIQAFAVGRRKLYFKS